MSTPIKLDGMLVKVESSYGTDPTPSASTDSVRLSDRFWSSITVTPAFPNRRENTAPGTLLPIAPGLPRGWMVTGEIGVELRGAGAAYSASVLPDVAVLLRSCGLTQAIDTTGGSEFVTYTPASSSHSSCTIYGYANGLLYIITGVRANVRWPWTAGGLGMLRFSFQGFLAAAPTTVSLPAITYAAPVPPGAVAMSLTVGSWSPDVIGGEFDLGAVVQRNDSGNATDGIAEFAISEFHPKVKLSTKAVLVATANPHSDIRAATSRAINWTYGATQYNKALLVNTNAYYASIRNTEQNRFTGWDLESDLVDAVIKFT